MNATTTLPDNRNGEVLIIAFLATVTMLFAGFTAAYMIRSAAVDWRRIPLPHLVWWNTAVLVASSITIEIARRTRSRSWLLLTLGLGALFLFGQWQAWMALKSTGVFLPSHPHSAFFYMLTGVHGLHLLGGVGALVFAVTNSTDLRLTAIYWHFVDVLWIYVLVLLLVF